MSRILDVYLYETYVGELVQSDSDDLSFSYDKAYLSKAKKLAISVSMPLREEPYNGKIVKSFFSGLLPDESARDNLAKCLGVSEKNSFALLKSVGGECAGALSLYPKGVKPSLILKSNVEVLRDEQLSDILKTLKRRPLLAGVDGIRFSLAGVQDKIAVSLVDGKVALVRDASPTTYILKPAIEREGVNDSVYNELFCMRLAKLVGIEAPNVEVRKFKKVPYFLVERYDRIKDAKGVVKRLHQEDFCQALSIMPDRKYEREGGPSVSMCQDLLQNFSTQPARDKIKFFQRLAFNYLIGNADAHGKNFSLLYHKTKIELAPAYDILCTAIYPELTNKMAMKIGGKYEPERVFIRHWYRIAPDTKIAQKNIKKQLLLLSEQCIKFAEILKIQLNDEGVKSEIFDKISEVIKVRSESFEFS